MILELTEQQRQALKEQNGQHVEIVDPETRRAYVLVPREQYGQAPPASDETACVDEISLEIPPGIKRSQEAFWRDLPELLKKKKWHRQWACYAGEERIGIGKKKTPLVQECLARGLEDDQFYVGVIEEQSTPPWGPFEVDVNLFEVID